MDFATHLFEWLKFEMHSDCIQWIQWYMWVTFQGFLVPPVSHALHALHALHACDTIPFLFFFSKCQTTSCTSQTGSHWATMVIRVKVAIAWFNQMHQTSCMRLCLFVCVSPCEIFNGLCVFESIWNIWFQALLCWPTIGKPTLAPAPQQSHCTVCLAKPKTEMVQH